MSSWLPAILLSSGLLLWCQTSGDQPKVRGFDVPRELHIASKDKTPARSIEVVSWNIDHGSNLDKISDELSRNPGDLFLLQEVDWNAKRSDNVDVGQELARRLELSISFGIEFEELSQETGQPAYIGQATLSRFPIRRSRIIRFKKQSGFWKPRAWIPSNLPMMQRRLGSRIALVTDLDVNGKLLVVYNAHLESRSAGSIQAQQLNEMLADLNGYPAGTSVILGGDLNSKYFPSTVLHRLEREGFHSALGERIERTHAIAMALDWIFVRGPFEWKNGEVRRSFQGSDHYPIYATLNAK